MNEQISNSLLLKCDMFCQILFAECCAVSEGKRTEPDTAPDVKVIVSVGSLVLFHSHSHLFPFS